MGDTSTFLQEHPGPGNTEFFVNRAKGGSERAWKVLYDRYRSMLVTHLQTMIPGYARRRFDEEDVLQIAFAKAFRRIESFESRGEGSFRAWLARILHNAFLDELENQRREHARESSTDLGQLEDRRPEGKGGPGGPRAEMLEAMGLLSVEERDLLIQRHFDRRSFEEIGKSLGCSRESARLACAEVFEKLQRILKRE